MRERTFDPRAVVELVIAGWTGRDQAAVEKHIRELEAIGVPRPRSTPIFYRVAAQQLTTAPAIEVLGDASSGEVEPVIVAMDGELWVGAGSDHTDRKAETIGVSLSKQLCAKPVCPALWRHADVAGHWDQLVLRSYAIEGGARRLYQEGAVANMRPPLRLVELYTGAARLPDGVAMFCGTLAVHGGIRPAERFEMELHDPVLGRTIAGGYDIKILPQE